MSRLLNLARRETWSVDLTDVLSEIRPIAQAYELDMETKDRSKFDVALERLEGVLQQFSIIGWHNTRLTDDEVRSIQTSGILPLNHVLVSRRIKVQMQLGTISAEVGDTLEREQRGNDSNRAGKIWFCFYPPRAAGQEGLYRLFRYWGGEAIYWAHEDAPHVIEELRRLGRPRIIEAEVPIASLSTAYRVARSIIKTDLVYEGVRIRDLDRLEAYSVRPISPHSIIDVHSYPDDQFKRLSGCDEWSNLCSLG